MTYNVHMADSMLKVPYELPSNALYEIYKTLIALSLNNPLDI